MAGGEAYFTGGKASCKTMDASLATPSLSLVVRRLRTNQGRTSDHEKSIATREEQKTWACLGVLE